MTKPADLRRYAIAPVLGGIDLLAARYNDHRFPPHAQDHYVLGIQRGGAVRVRTHGRQTLVVPGQVLFITPRTIHSARPERPGPWEYRALYLSEEQFRSLAGGDAERAPPGSGAVVVDDAALARALDDAHERLQRMADGAAEADDEQAVVDALRRVARRCAAAIGPARRAPAASTRFERVRRYLDDSTNRRVSLDELASVAGTSRFTLAHGFSAAFGVSPHAYALQSRLREARRLLATGVPISHAAMQLGFADQSHLTRWFLRMVGVTPGEYVRAVQRDRRRTLAPTAGSRRAAGF